MIDKSTIDCEGVKGKYIGKHAGCCSGKNADGDACNFSLMADVDTKCPRCGSRVKKEKS